MFIFSIFQFENIRYQWVGIPHLATVAVRSHHGVERLYVISLSYDFSSVGEHAESMITQRLLLTEHFALVHVWRANERDGHFERAHVRCSPKNAITQTKDEISVSLIALQFFFASFISPLCIPHQSLSLEWMPIYLCCFSLLWLLPGIRCRSKWECVGNVLGVRAAHRTQISSGETTKCEPVCPAKSFIFGCRYFEMPPFFLFSQKVLCGRRLVRWPKIGQFG